MSRISDRSKVAPKLVAPKAAAAVKAAKAGLRAAGKFGADEMSTGRTGRLQQAAKKALTGLGKIDLGRILTNFSAAKHVKGAVQDVLKMVRFAGPLPADQAPHLGPNGKMVAPNGHELIRVRLDDGKGPISGQSQYALVDPQTNEFYVQNNAGGFLHPTTYNGPLSLPPSARFEGAPFSPAELHNFEQIANGKPAPVPHLPLPKPPLVPGLPTFPFPQLPGLNRFKLTLERHLKAGDLEFNHAAPKPADIRSQTVIKTEHPYTYTAVVLKSDPTHVIIKRELTGGIVMSKPGSETYSQPISVMPYFFID